MQNFPSNNKLVSIAGYYVTFWFIQDWKVASIPDPVNGSINFTNIIYNGDYTWYQGQGVFKSMQFGNEAKETTSGIEYPAKLEASWHNSPESTALFVEKTYDRFIVVIKDYFGRFRIIGQPGNGLRFSFKESNKWTEFVYQANYDTPTYYLTSVTLDPTPPPVDPGGEGGIVIIKRVDGTTISSVTAPTEYIVANTNAVLKDSAGATLSTTAIKAAGVPQEISAPDSTAVVKDSTGSTLSITNLKSGETKNIVAPDASAVIKDSAGATLSTNALKSGEAKNIVAPDATAVIKDSAGATLSTNALKSGETKNIVAPDASAVIKDSAGATLSTNALKSGETKNLTAPDATVNLNGAAFLTPKSGQTINATLVDEDMNPITPELTGSQIKVNIYNSAVIRKAARYANLILTGNSNSIIR